MTRTTLPRVVHVSADFPDPVAREKTPVIRSLLDLTADAFAHEVWSLNRRAPSLRDGLGGTPTAEPFAHGQAITYRAPPLGILHATMLDRLGDWLAERLQDSRPELLVGHKLTVEGLAVARAARLLGVPYALTLQGNTDLKILCARPDLRPRLAKIFQAASVVFAFAPWTLKAVERHLGARGGPSCIAPCPTDLDSFIPPKAGGEGLATLFHLQHYRNKNLAGMVASHAVMPEDCAGQPLLVFGSGSAEDRGRCQRIMSRGKNVRFAAPVARADLAASLGRARGFVLPSLRESFGLVHIEALFAGLPIIYSSGRAVDGHFDGLPFAIGVDCRNRAQIAQAMTRLVRQEAQLKEALAVWQQSDHARSFTRPAIASRFAEGLRLGLAGAAVKGDEGE